MFENEETNVAEKKASKQASKKVAKKVAKKAGKKVAKKAAKAPKGEGNGRALRENQIETLKALKGTSVGGKALTKGQLRAETGNQNLGMPNLEKRGYAVRSQIEDSRGYVFSITPEGSKALKAHN